MRPYLHLPIVRAAVLQLVVLLLGGGLGACPAAAQEPLALPGAPPAARDTLFDADLPEGAYAMLDLLNVRDADLRDVLRGIAHQYRLNLVVDNRIERRITVRLSDLPVLDALRFLCREHGLVLTRQGRILRVEPLPAAAVVLPPRVSVREGLLTVDLEAEDLEPVLRLIAQQSGVNILVHPGVLGSVTGTLREVPLEAGLRTLLRLNGFSLRAQDGIYHVGRGEPAEPGAGGPALWVQVEDSLVTLDVAEAGIADVLREVATQAAVNLVLYEAPEGHITARAGRLTLEETFDLLFKGTSVTYRREGRIFFVGNKQTSGIAATRLLRLNHIRADAVLELLPEALGAQAAIRVVKEHNGLLVAGPPDVIAEVARYVRELDHPTPQILIEALVVDFEATDLFELGVTFGRDARVAASEDRSDTGFGEGERGGLFHHGDARLARRYAEHLADFAGLFGVHKIGRLPDDFYFKLYALSREGRANIRSRPQISTLNGHPASISIGTTQYYILRTATPYTAPGQVVVQETERFERIEANVKLDVTPWVSASGEVTAEIRPEFSTPVGEFTPGVPPTINSRVLESTVRLQDGETIILGGLIQDAERVSYDKVPVLGSIPLLGRLFRGTSRDRSKAELVIFLTPHVFFGDARDEAKWSRLRDRLPLTGEDDVPEAEGALRRAP